MPRKIDLDEELKLAEAVMKKDGNHSWTLILRCLTPLYMNILQGALDAGRIPLSHYLNRVLAEHYETEATGGIHLDARQQETLQALCRVWRCTPKEALTQMFAKVATRLLKEELEAEKEHQQLVSKAK